MRLGSYDEPEKSCNHEESIILQLFILSSLCHLSLDFSVEIRGGLNYVFYKNLPNITTLCHYINFKESIITRH